MAERSEGSTDEEEKVAQSRELLDDNLGRQAE
jgi:hypothetical protein